MTIRQIIITVAGLSAAMLTAIGMFWAIASLTDFAPDPVGALVFVTVLTGLLQLILYLAVLAIASLVTFLWRISK